MEKSRKINVEKEGAPCVCVRGVVARAFHGAALLPPVVVSLVFLSMSAPVLFDAVGWTKGRTFGR